MSEPILDRLANTGGSDLFVKIACPRIDHLDIPVTDFNAFSRTFIANIEESPLFTMNMPVDSAYNFILEKCIERKMSHVVIVESDMAVPTAGVCKLLARATEGHPFVCAAYPFKDGTDLCVAVTHDKNGRSLRVPNPYNRRGLIPVERALPMGFCIIDLAVVAKLPKPWFKTTTLNRNGVIEHVSQDVYFTNLLIAAGHQPMLDTDIQCVHVSRETGKCFGTPEYVTGNSLNENGYAELAINRDRVKTAITLDQFKNLILLLGEFPSEKISKPVMISNLLSMAKQNGFKISSEIMMACGSGKAERIIQSLETLN